jgi:catechol 2,3-dioxygenase-like lactoylglutathione lyase family enzyme
VDRPADARVDDIVAVELAVKDPDAAVARWSVVFGMPVGADGSSIDLGGREVRFVPRGDATGLSHVQMHAVDRADAGHTFLAGPVRFTLV